MLTNHGNLPFYMDHRYMYIIVVTAKEYSWEGVLTNPDLMSPLYIDLF